MNSLKTLSSVSEGIADPGALPSIVEAEECDEDGSLALQMDVTGRLSDARADLFVLIDALGVLLQVDIFEGKPVWWLESQGRPRELTFAVARLIVSALAPYARPHADPWDSGRSGIAFVCYQPAGDEESYSLGVFHHDLTFVSDGPFPLGWP